MKDQDPDSSAKRAPIDAIANGSAKAVDVTGLERELAALWEPGDQVGGGDDVEAITRACTLTLVVYAESREQVQRAERIIPRVSAHDPCRAIVVSADPSSDDAGLEAWISANCFLPGPGVPQVCCEQISIAARGGAIARVPGLVTPLLVSDLPVVVWWLADSPLDSPVFGRLVEGADRVIVDSSTFSDACAGLARLSRASLGRHRRIPLSDLNWARLTSWRNLVAQFFDSPAALPYAWSIESASVEYASGAGDSRLNRGQAALLVGWLASRLGWSVEAGCGDCVGTACQHRLRAADGAPIRVHIRPASPGAAPAGGVLALELRSAGSPGAAFGVAQSEDGRCVETSFEPEGRAPVVRVSRLEPADDAQLLSQELEMLERDEVFEETLALVGQLAGE